MKTKRILTMQARPGMVVAEDVYASGQQLIVARETVLDNRAIAMLRFYSVTDIKILLEEKQNGEQKEEQKEPQKETLEEPLKEEKKEEPSGVPPEPEKQEPNFNEAVRKTKEYQMFNVEFRLSVVSLKGALDRFVSDPSRELDMDKLLNGVDKVLSEGRNGVHVIHMLQCMRNFDDLTYIHSMNVALLCSVFAKWCHFSNEDEKLLVLAGLLHDIGKLKIPSAIVMKPDALTDEEYQIMKTHPEEGYVILKDQDIDPRIKLSALMHHEKCDGSGYPNRLTSDKIEEFAKIIAIVDTYDAMTSARIYRGALCPFEVISTFEENGYQKYDPKFLLPFLQGIVDTYLHCNVRLSDGQMGEIVFTNSNALSRPMIQTKDGFIDLAAKEYRNLKITELL